MALSDLSFGISQKILCGIDGTDRSAKAARVATELARRLGAELVFAMVNPRLAARAAILYVWSDAHIAGILEKTARRALWHGAPSVGPRPGAPNPCPTRSWTMPTGMRSTTSSSAPAIVRAGHGS